MPLLLVPESSGINKEQRTPDRSKTAHKKPPVKCFLTDGETVETVTDFIFGGSKITEDGDCRHEIKRYLLLVRKVMTNLDSILKSKRHYFANKGSLERNTEVCRHHFL